MVCIIIMYFHFQKNMIHCYLGFRKWTILQPMVISGPLTSSDNFQKNLFTNGFLTVLGGDSFMNDWKMGKKINALPGSPRTNSNAKQVWLNILATLPETNIAPENGWLEDWFPFGMAYFRGLCFREGTWSLTTLLSHGWMSTTVHNCLPSQMAPTEENLPTKVPTFLQKTLQIHTISLHTIIIYI